MLLQNDLAIDRIVIPFVSSMLAGMERRNAVYFPYSEEKYIKLFKKFTNWQLNNSSLQHLFDIETTSQHPDSEILGIDISPTDQSKLAICVSGGIDSTIAVLWAVHAMNYHPSEIKLLTVDYGAPYSGKELKVLSELLPIIRDGISYDLNNSIALSKIHLKDRLSETQMGKGYIIPNRNSVIASFGTMLAPEVWISANYRKIDDEPGAAMDKNRKFYWSVSHLLSLMWGKPTKVTSPFLHMSKSESIAWLIDELGLDYANTLLDKTVTCYHATELACGNCFACYKASKSLWELRKEFPGLKTFENKFGKFAGTAPEFFKDYSLRELMKGRKLPDTDFWKFFGLEVADVFASPTKASGESLIKVL